MALALDQVRAGLCQRRGERGVRGEHGAPHLAAGGQPHHRLRRTPPTPRIGNLAKRECHIHWLNRMLAYFLLDFAERA